MRSVLFASFMLAALFGVLFLSACNSQVDKGYELKATVPVNGEVIFH